MINFLDIIRICQRFFKRIPRSTQDDAEQGKSIATADSNQCMHQDMSEEPVIIVPQDLTWFSAFQSSNNTPLVQNHPNPEDLFQQRIDAARKVLGRVDGKVLDNQQMRCVIDSSPRQLVIAGAGTGKTTTVIAKIIYLLKSQAVSSNEIAVFSYTHPSAQEIRDRIRKATDSDVYAATFHSFAARIIAEIEGKHRIIAQNATEGFIRQKFTPEHLSDAEKLLLCQYVLYGGDAVHPEQDFISHDMCQDYLKRHLRRPINGKPVETFGSFVIANYLTIHGINHIYYKNTDNFLLIGKNIFIQYYPFHSDEWSPIFYDDNCLVAQEKFSAHEKQRLSYQKSCTTVIRCYSDQLSDGTLAEYLTRELSRYGVKPVLRPSAELWSLAFPPDGKELLRIQNTMCTIVSLIHGNNLSVDSVSSLINEADLNRGNNTRIMQLIQLVYPAYKQYLVENGLTTFDDLIISAIDYLNSGTYKNPFKFLIVDEYQDIAPLRVSFLQALLRSSSAHLLCVGDDWQSIYGFNGSNVEFILDFEKDWGKASVNKIEKTYRFSQSLVDALGEFVMKNPNQVKKQIRGHDNLEGSALRVLIAENTSHALDLIAQTLDGFPLDSTVFFIGRFNNDWEHMSIDCIDFETSIDKGITSIVYRKRPDLQIRFLTAHASKGLEADNVIIINARNEVHGFPSQIPTHSIVELLQNQKKRFPYDEERRLFYVAATRTKTRTFIVCEKDNRSAFVDEIMEQNPDVLIADPHICPRCGAPLIEVEDTLCRFFVCERHVEGACSYSRDCS